MLLRRKRDDFVQKVRDGIKREAVAHKERVEGSSVSVGCERLSGADRAVTCWHHVFARARAQHQHLSPRNARFRRICLQYAYRQLLKAAPDQRLKAV